VLFVLVVLAHHRRRVIQFNVTEHPTSLWTAQQMVEAFPDDPAPRYLLRDRDKLGAGSVMVVAGWLVATDVLSTIVAGCVSL
jgi:hypothetical protein